MCLNKFMCSRVKKNIPALFFGPHLPGEMNVSPAAVTLVVTLLGPDAPPSYGETLVQIITSFNKEMLRSSVKLKHNLQSQ